MKKLRLNKVYKFSTKEIDTYMQFPCFIADISRFNIPLDHDPTNTDDQKRCDYQDCEHNHSYYGIPLNNSLPIMCVLIFGL